jgi:rfaE bifunctional protein kinase chain/domain
MIKSKNRVLVVGDIMLDRYWFGDVNRISPEAPVPIVRVESREERLGGAANVARNAVALGVETGLLGVVGKDEASSIIDQLIEKSGIQNYLHQDESISTIIKLRVIGRQQQLLRIDFEEKPNEKVLLDKLSRFTNLVSQYDVIILSDYAKGALVNVSEMIATANKHNKLVLVDPKGSDYSIYSGAMMLTPNKSELRQVIGSWQNENELEEKVTLLRHKLNIKALLLTRSEEGMTLFEDEGAYHVPTMAREVFDVSGAGDTVIATVAAMLAEGRNLRDSVAIANKAGGIVVGKLGTATVFRSELFEEE